MIPVKIKFDANSDDEILAVHRNAVRGLDALEAEDRVAAYDPALQYAVHARVIRIWNRQVYLHLDRSQPFDWWEVELLIRAADARHTHPLAQADMLRELVKEGLAKLREKGEDLMAPITTRQLRLYLWQQEAVALEQGYRLGRVHAAYDIRTGLDRITTNGSVHYDSDTEPPPLWLIESAEKLARGDA